MMSEELGQGGAETGKGPSGGPGGDAAGSDRGIQAARSALRRRMLLRGLVVAPATLAVMRPVKTLAKAKKVCSYSGWHSFKINPHTSASPKNKHCKTGYSTKFYASKYASKIPKSKTKKGRHVTSNYTMKAKSGAVVTLYQSTLFNTLFGSGGGSGKTAKTLLYYLQNASANPNQSAFITALFNAYYFNRSGYPYTCQDIYTYWVNPTKLSPDAKPPLTQNTVALYFQQLDSFG
jgi:hypothetical protein